MSFAEDRHEDQSDTVDAGSARRRRSGDPTTGGVPHSSDRAGAGEGPADEYHLDDNASGDVPPEDRFQQGHDAFVLDPRAADRDQQGAREDADEYELDAGEGDGPHVSKLELGHSALVIDPNRSQADDLEVEAPDTETDHTGEEVAGDQDATPSNRPTVASDAGSLGPLVGSGGDDDPEAFHRVVHKYDGPVDRDDDGYELDDGDGSSAAELTTSRTVVPPREPAAEVPQMQLRPTRAEVDAITARVGGEADRRPVADDDHGEHYELDAAGDVSPEPAEPGSADVVKQSELDVTFVAGDPPLDDSENRADVHGPAPGDPARPINPAPTAEANQPVAEADGDGDYELEAATAIDPEADLRQMVKQEYARDAERPIVQPGKSLPDPPASPFITGVFTFPFYQSVLANWLAISVALMATGLMSGFTFIYGSQVGMMAIRALGPAVGMLAVLCFSYVASICLVIIEETANGWDEIDHWPDVDWRAWFISLCYMGAIAIECALVGWIVNLPFQLLLDTYIPMTLVAFVLYPIGLLSALEVGSPWMPYSRPVILSLNRVWWAWVTFYLESAAVAGVTVLITLGSTRAEYWSGIAICSPVVGAALLIYARLLGRLGWVASGSVDEDD